MMQETGEIVCYRFEMRGEEGKLRYLATGMCRRPWQCTVWLACLSVYTEASVAAATFASFEEPTG